MIILAQLEMMIFQEEGRGSEVVLVVWEQEVCVTHEQW
jgi:hypothetical protein